ncbi:unnamed protein product [Larinioides sclopetarius]
MYFLRGHLFRSATYFLKQNHFLYFVSVQNQNKVQFHCVESLLQNNKQADNTEVKPIPDEDVWIGPPHPTSQLRIKVFPQSEDFSEEEKAFYLQCKKTQEWHHQYWEAHNKEFHESRNLFIDKMAREKNLTRDEVAQSDDMALFYQHFLKRNYSKHMTYN